MALHGEARRAGCGKGGTVVSRDLSYDLVVRSSRTILPDGEAPAAVAVRDGRIAALAPYGARLGAARDEDLKDVALLPGLVDPHVHTQEPGRPAGQSFAAATAAAAAGGVTTILDMVVPALPATVSVEALQAKRAAADGNCAVDVGFWAAVVPGRPAEIGPLYDAGVIGFTCFLAGRAGRGEAGTPDSALNLAAGSGTEAWLPLGGDEFRAVFALLAGIGPDTLISVHAEDWSEIRQAHGPGYGEFLASRPPRAERRAIEKVVAAAAATGVRAHIAHLSAAECAALIAGAKAAGIALTAETCPHYLFFAAEEVRDGATEFKTCPPIRGGINREALWRALEGETVDCVASGHSPRAAAGDGGAAGDFGAAGAGIAGLELSLPAVWTVARRRRHGLTDVVRWMAQRPAELTGLHWKGRLAVGCDADLVAFDPNAMFTVRGADLVRRDPATPYEGRVLTGAVRAVWLRGQAVTAGGPLRGQLITRGKA
jgi:allantoinase